ncbi:MAG: hypothetical protein M1836_001667 [Candelina mexicana]|nr:MAG: hypothetical protein M1836_001667 [Candelina mexicana]
MLMGLWHRKTDEQDEFDQNVSPYDDKQAHAETVAVDNESGIVVTHGGTRHDALDMHRVGKQQQLKRNFRFLSILGFTCTLMSTWEGIIASSTFGLIDGGLAGMIWIYIGTTVGFLAVVASMADMASMAPTSGGQYHWVSEFAPQRYQKFLSYIVGWLSALGWQSGTGSSSYLAGTMIQAILVFCYPEYTPTRWQGSLFMIAMVLIATFFNTWGASQLPTLEGVILVLHIFGFFAILIPLWVLAPRNSATEVFTSFSNGGGWPSMGTAVIIGQIVPIFCFVGPDAATHMAEEIKDASIIVPRCMIWTAVLNATLGFIILITYCFCITDLQGALNSPTGALGYPYISVFYGATNSKGGTVAMTSILIALLLCCCISILATASRQTFAFARDNGLPFSPFFSKVSSAAGLEIPLNAVLGSLSITTVLALINIGSTAAFNCIVSLLVSSLFTSYFISISCILLKRLKGEPLPPSRWSLGSLAIPLNIFALAYIFFAFIMSFFPIYATVTTLNMNWAVLIYSVVMIFAISIYFLYGRNIYEGPVVKVRQSVMH